MLIKEVVLITEDMGVLLVCNLLQFQDASIQTDASESRVISGSSPSLDLQVNRQTMRIASAIPLMPQSSNLEQSTRLVTNAYSMVGVSYLPWMSGVLEECPGEGYWLLFNQRLPISYEVGDCLYKLLHHSWLLRDKEDAEGEIAGDAVEEIGRAHV